MPDFELICGGFPCQSFSIAGKRRGFDDTRGTLFFEIARIAAVKRPKYLLLENVPGLLSHDSGRTFATILSTLDELGYDVAWQVLNSANFHVAQSRKRVFIVGFLRTECTGRVLSFTDANPKTLIQRIPGREGCRVYSPEGLSITLTGNAGGFGGKSGLYEILGLPIKSLTKSGYLSDKTNLSAKAKAEKHAKITAKTIINIGGGDSANYGQNAFFYDAAEGLLGSVILLLVEFGEKNERHIVSVFKLIQDLIAKTPARSAKEKPQMYFTSLMESCPLNTKQSGLQVRHSTRQIRR